MRPSQKRRRIISLPEEGYINIDSIEGNYKVERDNENENDDDTILKSLDDTNNKYPNPKYFDKVFIIADVGTDKAVYRPDTYYRKKNKTEASEPEVYELDRTESGKESEYDKSDYYIWKKDGSDDEGYLKTANEFFIPNVYYHEKDGVMEIASLKTFDDNPNSNYYKGRTYYVIKDDLGHYTPGAEWNPAVVPVPKSVHLGTRKEMYKWEKLEDFSRTYNTLNGLILKTNKLLILLQFKAV